MKTISKKDQSGNEFDTFPWHNDKSLLKQWQKRITFQSPSLLQPIKEKD